MPVFLFKRLSERPRYPQNLTGAFTFWSHPTGFFPCVIHIDKETVGIIQIHQIAITCSFQSTRYVWFLYRQMYRFTCKCIGDRERRDDMTQIYFTRN